MTNSDHRYAERLHGSTPPSRRWLLWSAIIVAGFASLTCLAYFTARVEVMIEPPGAEKHASLKIVQGVALSFGTSVFAAPGPLVLHVAAPGYKSTDVRVSEAGYRRGRIDVILDAVGVPVRVTADPPLPDVVWRLDGQLIATGESLEIDTEPGEHTIQAFHPHRLPASIPIAAVAGEMIEETLILAPVRGTIEVSSDPSGSKVLVNGEFRGTTPLTTEVVGGIHELQITHDDYESRSDRIEITHEAPEASLAYTLAVNRPEGQVAFTLNPPGGILTVDDQALTPANATRGIRIAASISHAVRYTLPGYKPADIELTLAPGESRNVAFDLEPNLGIVEVHAEPESEVEVDGKPAGTTPLTLELLAVPHKIRIAQDGYRSVTRTLTPDPDAPQRIRVTLDSEAELRSAEAPTQYTNDIGIMLKLFPNPGIIKMGSARDEAGRRPNEFVREVHLTRSFYVSVHEISIEQYAHFTSPGQTPPADRRAVTGITWTEAAQFCNWLSGQEGLTPVYLFTDGRHVESNPHADGYRLPTEAEWAWLARKAGRARGTAFPWGDREVVPKNAGNLADESAKGTLPMYIPQYSDGFAGIADIGSFPANEAGLHDIVGNASEFVHDTYRFTPPPEGRVETDPFEIRTGSRYTVRGSSFRSSSLAELRAAWRDGAKGPEDDIGFRVARYVVGEP